MDEYFGFNTEQLWTMPWLGNYGSLSTGDGDFKDIGNGYVINELFPDSKFTKWTGDRESNRNLEIYK